MKPRTAILTAAVAIAVLHPAAAPAAPLTVRDAARAAGGSPSQLAARAGLSRADLARYVAGAQSVGGLTPQALTLTLRRPHLIRSVPVAFERGSTSARAAAMPARGCRESESYVWFKSVAGIQLWRFAQAKYWCWNRRTRRVNSKPNVKIKVRIRQAAALSGWDYAGLDEGGKDDHLFEFNGARRGGHSSMRRGVFKWCPPKILCLNTRRPTVTVENHYDGTVRDERSVG